MGTILLRSACVGIASAVVATVAGVMIFGISAAILHPSPPGSVEVGWEVGWDLVAMADNYPALWLLPLPGFGIGSLLAYRYFSNQGRSL